ncbi:MAG: alpha/beta fold hydrolase [Alphaproteobacteria bacterium]
MSNPEIGKTVNAAGFATNYLEQGSGAPVVLIHGSGPGVTAYANWRLTIPELAKKFRVLAPDIVGFGHTERKADIRYTMDLWLNHIVGFLDAVGLARVNLVGNSFGGALGLALTARHPDRVNRLVLMGAAGGNFKLTAGLDYAWGFQPSIENMRRLVSLFAYNKAIVTDDLVRSRHEASIRPGYQETYSQMFPAPRQAGIEMLATPDEQLRGIDKEVLIVHGREDQIIPLESSLRLNQLLDRSQLHVFGRCGHWTQVEHAARFSTLVANFLAEAA